MTNRKEKIDMYANKLKDWNDKIQNFEANLKEQKDELEENLKKQAEEKINSLKNKLDDAERKLKSTENEPESFWEDIQKGIETNWKELELTVKDVVSPLHQKTTQKYLKEKAVERLPFFILPEKEDIRVCRNKITNDRKLLSL